MPKQQKPASSDFGTITPRPPGKGDHVILVDGSGYIFRAYHALPPLTRSDGLPVGALAGFCNMLNKFLADQKNGDRPTHLAVIFDTARATFRNEIYAAYKANRPPPPEDLIPQFPLFRDATRAFNVACLEMDGFEADDLIATYARLAARLGARVTIVSSDKDLAQLVCDGAITLYDSMKDKRTDEAAVLEKFGVTPAMMIDLQSLAGDSTDNVPGVPGIGVKTAAQLLNEFGDLDALLSRLDEIRQPKRRETLQNQAEQARISRELVRLKDDVPVSVSFDQLVVRAPDPEKLIGFLKGLEFSTLTRRVGVELGVSPDDISALPVARQAVETTGSAATTAVESRQSLIVPASSGLPALQSVAVPPADPPIDRAGYETLTDAAVLQHWIAQAYENGFVAVDTETDSLDAMQARLVGVSLALAPGKACYIPLRHVSGEDLDFEGKGVPAQMPLRQALAVLKPLLEDPSVLKIGQNIKYDVIIFRHEGIEVMPIDDTMLMSYALDAGLAGHGMDALAERHLGHQCIAFKDVTGTGKNKLTFDKVPLDRATQYAAEDADVTLRLARFLKPRLVGEHQLSVYETLERPMVHILADMEWAGIKIDRDMLARLSRDFARDMQKLEEKAHELAGEVFNLGSTRQLGEILFERMGIESLKRTKKGAAATDADVLETLAAQGHELPQIILEWRQLSKLKGTYTDALPGYVHPETGRVHTSYALASTTTGRLSSSDPNLQNIPIRTEAGREIRRAFIAEKGHLLISADYSQIELRVLAHMADVDALKKAFRAGADIHAMTASEIFNVPMEKMDPIVRRSAKAINFGIIYGISAFGLANQLGLSRGQAQAYIDAYFRRFPGIRDYMEKAKATAHEQGHVRTLFGRKCHMRDINAKNAALRAFQERAAINAPIQGTAADIIRRAMIRMPEALRRAGLRARMLLQIHDELIFEAPEAEVERATATIKEVMEAAPLPLMQLSVPLVVDANAGLSWAEAH
jgi:DNA polymerase-1